MVLGGLLSFSARQDMKHAILTLTIASLLATTAFADPIHDAANRGDLAAVQSVLDKGANVNAKDDDGATPLHHAAWKGYKEIADLLRKHGGKTEKELKAADN